MSRGLRISAGTLSKYRNLADKAMDRVKRVREQSAEVVEQVSETMVSTGTAFGLGVLQGKTGGIEVAGLPLDLLVGGAAHVAGFMKMGGRHSKTLHSMGNGALASYAVTMGRSVGVQWKVTGSLTAKPKVSGSLPESGSDFATDEDLARAVLRR